MLAGTAAGALGAYDDLAEGGVRKGLRGHLGALARGEVTTGAVKVLGLGAAGLAASAVVRAGDADRSPALARGQPTCSWAGPSSPGRRTC